MKWSHALTLKEFMNSPKEVHAFIFGLYDGLHPVKTGAHKDNKDIKEEPHYYSGGVLVGEFLKYGVLFLKVVGSGC